jgi:hypothetical protein
MMACSVFNKNDHDKDVKAFLADFNSSLSQSDEVIWKQFMTLQNREEIFKVIRILQNKHSKNFTTKVINDDLLTRWEDGLLYVDFPVEFLNEGAKADRDHLAFRLMKKNGRFYIAGVEGEDFYYSFFSAKSKVDDEARLASRMSELKFFYDRAARLQKYFDSIIWFVKYKDQTYHYAVNGLYDSDSLTSDHHGKFKMGLVDSLGRIVIPIEFDLVGTLGFTMDNCIEVKKDRKIGYFNLEGKMLLPTEYDWLISYKEGRTTALLKKDTLYSWIDKDFRVYDGFPSDKAERQVKQLEYLTSNTFNIGHGYQSIVHQVFPVTEDYIYRSNGLIVPSNYFVLHDIFPEVEQGYITESTDGFYQMGDVSVENKNNKPFSIGEKLEAFIADFNNRFVGGRGEFYMKHKIILMNDNNEILSSLETRGDYDFKFRRINEQLFESQYRSDNMGPNDVEEQNFPDYDYFSFDGKELKALNTNRRFSFTQFIKLDSSYLSGNFETYDYVTGKADSSKFVCRQTLEQIRNGILADYGFIFSDPKEKEPFENWPWYKPTIESYEEVYNIASEIDKHNLDFLNKLIGSAPSSKPI